MGHRRLANALRLACPLALAAGLLATGSPGGAVRIAPPGPAAGHGALTSLTLTSVGSDGGAADAPSTQAAVAADGRYVAFQSKAALSVTASVPPGPSSPQDGSAPVSRIYVHDLVGGGTTLLSDQGNGDATEPDISANGRLVSYQQGGTIYVDDRQATGSGPFDSTGNLVVHQVTGTANDLGYERGVPCPAGLGAGQGRVAPCGPRLSADGSTLVYPAELSPVSPQLAVSASGGEEGGPAAGSAARTGAFDGSAAEPSLDGDMVDFTPYYPGDCCELPDSSEIVSYLNSGDTLLAFSGRGGFTITEPPGFKPGAPFGLGDDTCTGDLRPGQVCTIEVTFDTNTCTRRYLDQQRLVTGGLESHTSTPAGQSVVEMTAFCNYYEFYGPAKPAGNGVGTTAFFPARPHPAPHRAAPVPAAGQKSCPTPPSGLPLVAAPATTSDNQDAPLTSTGGTETGRPYVLWDTVSAPYYWAQATFDVTFLSANRTGCGIQLVDPANMKLADPLPKSAPRPCANGEELANPSPPSSSPSPSSPSPPSAAGPAPATSTTAAPPSSCTAYLLVEPGAISPDSAFLGTDYWTSSGPDIATQDYVTTWGVRHVIVARHDASGSGNFAASPSTVVSVTGGGAGLPDASQPSVSADGRYVSFAAPAPAGSNGQQAAAGATQVWLHDTDKAGNGSYEPGATTLVSCLPRPRAGPCQAAANAGSPSVSGDGQRVAFATTAAVAAHNGYPGTGTDANQVRATGQVSPDQVYLYSAGTAGTTLVSAPFTTGNRAGKGTGDDGRTAGRRPTAGGNGASYAPVISQDSSTVGYVSRATDLTGARVPAGTANLYLRPASPGATANELVSASGASMPTGSAIGPPSIDTHGRLMTFPATAALTTGAPQGIASVYTFDRLPSLSSSPAAAGFGAVLIDSGTHSLTVDVTDSGPGPGTVTGVGATGPFHISGDRCTGMTLYQGSRCAVTITFRPAKPGAATGGLTVTTQDDDEPPIIADVAAAATVPAPKLTVSPNVASAGEATQATGSSFPPHQKITLTWSLGLGSGSAVTSAAGRLSAALVIFPDDFIGPRTLIARGRAGPLATAPFLVQEGAIEPPFSQQPSLSQPGP